MALIHIDGNQFEADERDNLLKVALSLGFNLPYFCWHPCLDSVGACRQCAVKQYKDADDDQGKIVMACMTAAADETRISINDPEARDFRASIIEWLMINHPHDCPVCEEGGECHLQDMTLMTGHTRRRFRGAKRTHRNQYLGPFINHEMNRCIACYRCVRYYRDYAGGDDLNAFGAHHHVYFGRHEDGTLESPFSGNLVEVCPTGVFTDRTLGAHYTRKWDLETAPGICQHCSLGCNTSPGARNGVLKRIQNRYHGEINGYFLCDRGRFGAGFVNREDRPTTPLLRKTGELEPLRKDVTLNALTPALKADRLIGIGSPRASLEANYALRRLVGADNFSTGMTAADQALTEQAITLLQTSPAAPIAMREAEQCDAVLVLGEDVTRTAPRLALSLRQSTRRRAFDVAREHDIPAWHDRAVRDITQERRSPLFQATVSRSDLADVAAGSFRGAPEQIAALGFAVAHALDGDAPAPENMDDDSKALAGQIADALRDARRPLIVSGTTSNCADILQACANVAQALGERGHLLLTAAECNSVGLGLMGGAAVDTALERLESEPGATVVLLENDLYQRAPKARVDAALEAAGRVIVIDHSMQASLAAADAVLPAGTFAESDGTLVNNEGRAQRYFQVYPAAGDIQDSWRWCADLMALRGETPEWRHLDDLLTDLAGDLPTLSAAVEAAPPAHYRQAGMRFARQPHRYSGRTALHAHESVHERRPVPDPDSALAFSMEGWPGQRPAALRPFAWTPGWNSNQQAITRFQDEVAGPLKGGNPGAMCLARAPSTQAFTTPTLTPGTGWRAVACPHIFGSEALSALAPAVAERMDRPCFTLNANDARHLSLQAGDEFALDIQGETHRLPVIIDPDFPAACIGVPVGMAGLQGLALPCEVHP